MKTENPVKPVRIFVSYAREDRRWFDEHFKHNLIPWLVASLEKQSVTIWYDKALQTGDPFEKRIDEEIDQSHIAILMLTQAFLNSDFIEKKELPRIIHRADRNELRVFPVLIEPCTWQANEFLSKHNMLPGEPTPLIDYTESESRWAHVRHEILVSLIRTIETVRPTVQPAKSPGALRDATPHLPANAPKIFPPPLTPKEEGKRAKPREKTGKYWRVVLAIVLPIIIFSVPYTFVKIWQKPDVPTVTSLPSKPSPTTALPTTTTNTVKPPEVSQPTKTPETPEVQPQKPSDTPLASQKPQLERPSPGQPPEIAKSEDASKGKMDLATSETHGAGKQQGLDQRSELGKGRLFVESDPANAQVRILDIQSTYSPGMELESGEYQLEISLDGYETLKRRVTVEKNQKLDLNITLKPAVREKVSPAPRATPAPDEGPKVRQPGPGPQVPNSAQTASTAVVQPQKDAQKATRTEPGLQKELQTFKITYRGNETTISLIPETDERTADGREATILFSGTSISSLSFNQQPVDLKGGSLRFWPDDNGMFKGIKFKLDISGDSFSVSYEGSIINRGLPNEVIGTRITGPDLSKELSARLTDIVLHFYFQLRSTNHRQKLSAADRIKEKRGQVAV